MPSGDFLGLKPTPSQQGFPAQLEGFGGCVLAISLGCGWFNPPAPAHVVHQQKPSYPPGQPSHKKVITGCLPKLVCAMVLVPAPEILLLGCPYCHTGELPTPRCPLVCRALKRIQTAIPACTPFLANSPVTL